jgi:hypothetical protein
MVVNRCDGTLDSSVPAAYVSNGYLKVLGHSRLAGRVERFGKNARIAWRFNRPTWRVYLSGGSWSGCAV